MHVNDYVEQVHEHMRAAAALGDERTQQIAATLADTADASVRLALLAAVSAAANEITAALIEAGGPAVTVAVDGDQIRIDIARMAPEPATDAPADDGDATARISLRLPERLKADIEQAAGREGVSVNTWIVRSANAALNRGPGWSGPGWGGPGWAGPGWGGGPHGRGGAHRVTGWVTG